MVKKKKWRREFQALEKTAFLTLLQRLPTEQRLTSNP